MALKLAEALGRCPLVAILRGVRPEEAEEIATTLEAAGIVIVEVPLNSPDPLDSIARLARRFAGRLLVGAGTVRRPEEVAEVAAAGGRLIVMPHADAAVVAQAKARDLIAVPGFFSPSEAFAMLDAGADALKFFPAEAVPPATLRALRAVLPSGTMVLPVGGMDATTIPAWRSAGAAGFGIGSALYRPGDTAADVGLKARALLDVL
ncbi:MAG: 2-dehydro-3-deoxy-6-phosphogalactonate aldolase [Rhodospirillales bacterium]|nr:2-dehydro-3-deoxy-6-phosphogalactonate aldolase [Rhodospirillales bacterium]